MVTLQERCDRATSEISLTARLRERIRRYAFSYGNGGWEIRLVSIFGRHLGPRLDQDA
jgi:hypothetical protein